MFTITFTDEERDAVLPQLSCRLDELDQLLTKEAEKKNTRRVIELSKFIEIIRGFTNKMLMAEKVR